MATKIAQEFSGDVMEYIKYKLTRALIVAFLFLSACNGGDGSGYWKCCRDYRYIHSQGGEEIR